jgi:hypothetical protein
MHLLSNNQDLSAVWAKPVPLPFFQNDAQYLQRFTGFSLATKLKTEEVIEEYGNDCDSGKPVIRYDQCSNNFISLWQESAKSMDQHVRRRGPAIVPGRAALIWPGLSLSHFLKNSIPAWNAHVRNATQVFGRWVFDQETQCKKASIDTAVCANLDPSAAASKVEAVIPWLGGDYNPWEACDTLQTGALVDGEYANEEIETSCHQLVCNKGMDSTFYKFHPTASSEEYRCAHSMPVTLQDILAFTSPVLVFDRFV